MAPQEKVRNYSEEFKHFEEGVAERHRRQMLEELRVKLEEMDSRVSKELLSADSEQLYLDKGYVRRKIQTSVGAVWIRVKRLKRREAQGGSLYALFDVCGLEQTTERAREHCTQIAVGQSYAMSRETLKRLSGMEMSRMEIRRASCRERV